MPGIKNILRNATGEAQGELRGKAMQCVGLIGEAVGEAMFLQDGLEVMDILMHLMVYTFKLSYILSDQLLKGFISGRLS
jgi:hypothetical protein